MCMICLKLEWTNVKFQGYYMWNTLMIMAKVMVSIEISQPGPCRTRIEVFCLLLESCRIRVEWRIRYALVSYPHPAAVAHPLDTI